ncbi:MAG: ABC transporter ATP-binding protein [Xanthomonadales bacterium]|nr:ABC transporter ATP-binding protein [Xanthomonadales bacterium]
MIQLNRVSRSFGDLLAVDQFSIGIPRGEIFGLLGPNGAGKSTLISLISGQLLPTSGSVLVNGLPPVSIAAKRQMGIAPQSLAVYEELSARDNLEFFGRLYGLNGAGLKSSCVKVLEFVGLSDRAADRVEHYSGGMKRRLNLAIALLHEPQVLLLDEPTVGVDPQSRNRLFESILALKAQGKTIVYTTHYMEEAEKLCDRVAIVEQGKLLALDSVDRLIRQHGGESLLSWSSAGVEQSIKTADPLSEIQRLLATGCDMSELSLARPNLEQVFLNLTGRHLRD